MSMSAASEPPVDATGRSAQDLDQTERAILALAEEDGIGCPCDLVVLEDRSGALTAEALDRAGEHEGLRVVSWTASAERAAELAARFAEHPRRERLLLPEGPEPLALADAVAGLSPHHVLGRLPAGLAELEDRARRLAVGALAAEREDLTLIVGDRVKHMTRSQNEVLATVFEEVAAGRGVGKSRALRGAGVRRGVTLPEPTPGQVAVPVRGEQRSLPLRAVGGVFGGARPDAGSLLLLDALDRALRAGTALEGREHPSVVDLGCGNGLLTLWAVAALPAATVLASDADADAVASTRAALAALAPVRPERIRVTWDDALSREADGSAELVLLNPPFHAGTRVDPTLVHGVLAAAARVLRPGGELWMVHNSHLRYRPEVERRIGPVQEHARDRRFTVLRAVRR